MPVSQLRGRPRRPAPLHMVAMRELTAAMRQIRIAATGDNTKSSVELLNNTIADLYPEAGVGGGRFAPSVPRIVDDRYLKNVELGHHSRLKQPLWLQDSGLRRDNTAHASRVPAWLVRSYDVAFGADGYLIDVYLWALRLQADNEHNPPRTTQHLPEHVIAGGELAYLSEGFADAPDEVHAVLAENAGLLRRHRARPSDPADWVPNKNDGSSSYGVGEEELPEGALVAPGEYLLARWVLHNTGTLPWSDRFIYLVSSPDRGIHAPPFTPLPDTAPGGSSEVCVPMRAPQRPGTYRACLKAGWPNGVYCFPNTLLGLIVSLVVPPADAIDWHRQWDRR